MCGMRGLAQLAGDDRAHGDMARARVDASMIELMRRPQVLRTIAQRDTDLFAAALSRCVRWSERERALKGERERGREGESERAAEIEGEGDRRGEGEAAVRAKPDTETLCASGKGRNLHVSTQGDSSAGEGGASKTARRQQATAAADQRSIAGPRLTNHGMG